MARLWRRRFDWGLWSESAPGLGERRDYLPRGRVLGGTSSLNTMIYIRGNRADHDEWASMGLAGWGYEDVLPYFRRAEDNEHSESHYHGVGGPLTVSEGRSKHPLVGACIEAAVDAGLAPTDDHNGPTQEGRGSNTQAAHPRQIGEVIPQLPELGSPPPTHFARAAFGLLKSGLA